MNQDQAEGKWDQIKERVQKAYGINNGGTIVGYYQDGSGTHGFLATPVPVPTTMLLLGSGLIGLVGLRKMRS